MPLQHPSLAVAQNRSLTDGLAAELAARNPDARVVFPDEVAEPLRLSRFLWNWSEFLIAFRDSNTVNDGTVIELGQLLGVSGIVLLSLFPEGDTMPAALELAVFECTSGRLEWAGSSVVGPLGALATDDRVSQIHERLSELLDSLPPLRHR
jgi:hypothetical protein